MHGQPQRACTAAPPMDHTTSSPLLPKVGSFSYSWSTSKPKPQPEERMGHGDITPSSIAADPASSWQCSFDFWLSVSEQTEEAMAVTDQMFLNGLLLPLHLASQHGHAGNKQPVLTQSLSLDPSQRMIASVITSRQQHPPPSWRPVSRNSSPSNLRGGTVMSTVSATSAVFRMTKLRLPSFGRCGKQHGWISFRFLVPLYRKMVRCVWRGKATEEKAKAAAPWRAGGAKAKLCDLGQENAIRDAILHGKRSL